MALPHVVVGWVLSFWDLSGSNVRAITACLHESRSRQVFVCGIVVSADPTVNKPKKAEEGLKSRESRYILRMCLNTSVFRLTTHSKYSSEE